MATITLERISKRFGKTDVVRGVDLEIEDKDFLVFVGPSGCGKSTLLRIIAGLENPDAGRILIDGVDVTKTAPAKRGLSMVFQSYALYPHMSVRDNMAFGLKLLKMPPPEIDDKVSRAAKVLELEEYMHKKPRQLSGGQRQRTAIGRAIVREPKGFLFDEPLSNLDAALRTQMRLEIVRLQRELATTTIYVTHDQVEAMTMATRIAVLNNGIVEQAGSPLDIYRHPANRFVAGFIGSPKMNFIDGEEAAKEGAAIIGVRPEHLLIDDDGKWEGEIEVAEHLGADVFLHVRVGGVGRLTVRADGDSMPVRGETVRLAPAPGKIHFFNTDGSLAANTQA